MISSPYILALKAIAKGEYDDLAGDPSKWASEIAYMALGGRSKDGQRVDNIDDLVAANLDFTDKPHRT